MARKSLIGYKVFDAFRRANDNFIDLYDSIVTSISAAVEAYLDANPPTGGLTINEIKADTDIADALTKKHASGSDNQDLSGKVDKATGYSLVADTEIAKIHASGSDNQDLSGLQPKETGKGLYPDVDASKLAGIASGATVGADWNTNLSNIPATFTPSTHDHDTLYYRKSMNVALIIALG